VALKAGFTGTRRGMTLPQAKAFVRVVCALPGLAEFHHGDCVGADDEAAAAVHALGRVTIVAHPPTDEALRAFNAHAAETRPPRPYLERNRAIVDATDVLVATPAEAAERRRSGTWSTVRYARGLGRRVVLVLPDGRVCDEPAG
jgi:hypothetical protein